MPTRGELIAELNWFTERMSNRVWTISVGVLAMSLAYIIESTTGDSTPFLKTKQVAIPAAIALLSLLSDLIQYFAGAQKHLALLKKMERFEIESAKFDTNSIAYKTQIIAYYTKIILCFISVSWLVLISCFRVYGLM